MPLSGAMTVSAHDPYAALRHLPYRNYLAGSFLALIGRQAVVAAATHTPFESRRRVFVIEGAHTMNDQAANSMLKTLEEPPSFAHLILLTDRLGEVMPTIRSRCLPRSEEHTSELQSH